MVPGFRSELFAMSAIFTTRVLPQPGIRTTYKSEIVDKRQRAVTSSKIKPCFFSQILDFPKKICRKLNRKKKRLDFERSRTLLVKNLCKSKINDTPQKTNIDTKNDCLEDVSSFKHGYFG